MQVEVHLASGKSCFVGLSHDSSVHELKAEAQRQLERCFLALIFIGQQLDPSHALTEVGEQDGDSISAVVQPIDLSSTREACALYVRGGSVVTWNDPDFGGDSQVQKQLRSVQIQATFRAFAAILGSGSTAAWCKSSWCASSGFQQTWVLLLLSWTMALQKQLLRVKQIQANMWAFAATLDNRFVVTWDHPGSRSSISKQYCGVCRHFGQRLRGNLGRS